MNLGSRVLNYLVLLKIFCSYNRYFTTSNNPPKAANWRMFKVDLKIESSSENWPSAVSTGVSTNSY